MSFLSDISHGNFSSLDPTVKLNKVLRGAARNTSDGFATGAKDEFNAAMDHLFDQKVNPLLNKVDYLVQNNISRANVAANDVLDNVADQSSKLITQAGEQYKNSLTTTFAEINQARSEALNDVRITIGTVNTALEERINQVSILVMTALKEATDIADKFTPGAFMENLVAPAFDRIDKLEANVYRDVASILDKVDAIVSGNIDSFRNDVRRLVSLFPNPFDECRRSLGFEKTIGLNDVQLYRLNECRQVRAAIRSLGSNPDVLPVLDIYGQLQANAVVMRRIVRGAPQAEDIYIRDWFKYGLLYKRYAKLAAVTP